MKTLTEFDKDNLKAFVKRFTRRFTKGLISNFDSEVVKYYEESRMNKESFIFFHKQGITMLSDNNESIVKDYIRVVNKVLESIQKNNE